MNTRSHIRTSPGAPWSSSVQSIFASSYRSPSLEYVFQAGKLSELLEATIRREIPQLLAAISQGIRHLQSELAELGPLSTSRGERMHTVLMLCDRFQRGLRDAVEGGEGGGERILEAFQESLGNAIRDIPLEVIHPMQRTLTYTLLLPSKRGSSVREGPGGSGAVRMLIGDGPSRSAWWKRGGPVGSIVLHLSALQEMYSVENVARIVAEADGYQPYLIAPELGYRRLVESGLRLFTKPAESIVHEVHAILESLVGTVLASHASGGLHRYHNLLAEIRTIALRRLEAFRDEALAFVRVLVEMEASYLTADFFKDIINAPGGIINVVGQGTLFGVCVWSGDGAFNASCGESTVPMNVGT